MNQRTASKAAALVKSDWNVQLIESGAAIMKNWKWEIEDDYAGPAPGAWAWISLALIMWVVIIGLFLHRF